MPSRPLRVAVVNDYALVVAGVAGLLRPFDDRVAVIEVNSQEPVVSVVDVVLFDTFGLRPGEEMDPDALLARGAGSPAVVVFGWNTDPALVQAALAGPK